MSGAGADLLAVPNVSEGRDSAALGAIAAAFERGGARLLHASADPDHHRAVFTLAAPPGALAAAVAAGAAEVLRRVDLRRHEGIHPRVGALDVAPIVHLDDARRGAACAEALVLADLLADLGLPVFLYGALAGGRTRAELRRGGPEELERRIAAGELAPDAGPPHLHPRAGATLVAARPPLGAFNVWLAPPATPGDARAIAATLRGQLGVRALGLSLDRAGGVQVSTNIEDLAATTPADVLAAVARHARPARGELVAPVPRAALAGWPADVPLDAPPPLEDLLSRV